jgi:signal transduction histidine kinase
MFKQARVRLTLLNIVLFGLVLAAFSVIFYVAFATVLSPTFDLAPELSNEQAAEAGYHATLDQLGLALLIGDLLVVLLVGLIAWVLAGRTLRPIREAHARQRRFVADASHEMRTPLAAIRASAEGALMDSGAVSTDQLRHALGVVATSADRLTRLTNDLLLLARADGLPTSRPEAVDLSVLVAETVEAFAVAHPDLPRPRLALAEDLRVVADPDEVGRIVANLLDNAIRYGRGAAAESVRIATRSTDRDAIVEVTDSGPGIAATDLERIFEPFHRVRSDAGAPGGNGLGLAIGRGLAQRNGGRLTVASQAGAGATFRLSLPRFR